MVIDQIPPLAALDQWLAQLSVGGSQLVWQNEKRKKAFILEMVAEIRQHLADQFQRERLQIWQKQQQYLNDETREFMQKSAAFVSLKSVDLLLTFLFV